MQDWVGLITLAEIKVIASSANLENLRNFKYLSTNCFENILFMQEVKW